MEICLGWSWLFPPYAWHFTARALEETDAIFFYGTILREYCEKDHSLGFELFKRMSVGHAAKTASRASEVNERPTNRKSLTSSNS